MSKTNNNINLKDGIYMNLIAVKGGVAYPAGRLSLGELSETLTIALMNGIEKSICDTMENNIKLAADKAECKTETEGNKDD